MMVPKYKPLYFINSISPAKLSNVEFVSIFEDFNEYNGPILIESKDLIPLNVSHFYKDGIASMNIENIKNIHVNVHRKYDDINEFVFFRDALINESIRRDLCYEDIDDICDLYN